MEENKSIIHNRSNLLEMLVESTKTAYVLLDINGCIIEVNEHLLKMLGCGDDSTIIGKSTKDFLNIKDHPKYDGFIKELLSGKRIENIEFAIECKNLPKCNVSWVRINAGLMRNGEVKIFCIVNNISKAKTEEMKKYIDEQKKRDKIRQSILRLRMMSVDTSNK